MNLKKVSDGLHKLNTSQIIALGFAGVIFVGGFILWLPFCSAPGQAVTFPDAVFTAATSVCVTGLSTVVMAVQWSPIGKVVILCLIQIGGIGLIALANMIFISLRRKISLKNRRIIKESYNLDEMGGVVAVVRSVVKCVFLAEGIGAVLYAFCFVPEFGIKKRSGACHISGGICILQRRDRSFRGNKPFGICEQSAGQYHYDWPDHCVRSWIYRLVGSVG